MRGSVKFSWRIERACYGGEGGQIQGGLGGGGQIQGRLFQNGEELGRRFYRSDSNIISCNLPKVSLTKQHLSEFLWDDMLVDDKTALVDGTSGASLGVGELFERLKNQIKFHPNQINLI